MNSMLASISRNEFETSDPIFRVIAHDHPWRFAALLLPKAAHRLVLCWRSDLVEPITSPDGYSNLWIGIDQRLACLTQDGTILLSLGLSSSLIDIKHFDACTIALCEDHLLAFNRDHSLRALCWLREIPEKIDREEGTFTVKFIDGTSEPVRI